MALGGSLTPGQLQAITVTERVNSAISVASIIFIAVTYLTLPGFNKPINRLIFFAGFGNLGTCIAALIADAGPLAGQESSVCQAQAFIVQMFLGVDGLWAFCMAINVYLAFFQGYSVEQFKRLDMWYLLFCYGLSFLPAFVFIFVSATDRGRIYGPATIWCWISERWNFMRFAFLYAWIWFAILFALIIYIRAAHLIYRRRHQLSGYLNPLNESPFKATITTSVEVTSEPCLSAPMPVASAAPPVPFDPDLETSIPQYHIDVDAQSTHSIKSLNHPDVPFPAMIRVRSYTRKVAEESINPDAWLYARVAFLFYVALIVTWVPSSVNRVYSLVHPGKVSWELSYVAGFMFPLQGFWNLVVYLITSRTACRDLARTWSWRVRGWRVKGDRVEGLKRPEGSRERFGSEDAIVWR
ncbi:hypothetical protein KVT40_001677 [Elsinoe batatas]|uniref:G-protein coupled receptors family 2 profile 2 domain-containing protein n=1 Tax=Elsinoe batatas TaxID=2601811 RepID=A0A8K0PJZ4_9PEZI|nr:hypothetical protein KVT40_001677 [Elsinoe batatas]